jgi:hypothetical protein
MVNNEELLGWKQRRLGTGRFMRDLGAAGWELVNVVWRKTGEMSYADPVYYFKRLLR